MVSRQPQRISLARGQSNNVARTAAPEALRCRGKSLAVEERLVLHADEVAYLTRALRGQDPAIGRDARIGPVFLVAEGFAALGNQVQCGFAVEDAWLAAL